MLRDFPAMIGLLFLGICIVVITSLFYKSDFQQDSSVLALTETVRTSAIANANNVSRIQEGELFISKNDFENDFKKRIEKNGNVKVSKDTNYQFKYLENPNGSVKAIRVVMENPDNNSSYQATCKIDISDN